MATRGEIAWLNDDGTIDTVYNHYDSYINNGLGENLYKCYNNPNLARKIFIDNKENLYTYSSLEEFENFLGDSDREFAYLWNKNEWEVLEVEWKKINRNWKKLKIFFNN